MSAPCGWTEAAANVAAVLVLLTAGLACDEGPGPLADGTVRVTVVVDPVLDEIVGVAGVPSERSEPTFLEDDIREFRFVLKTTNRTGDEAVNVEYSTKRNWWNYGDTVVGGNGLRVIEKTHPVQVEFAGLAPGVYRLPSEEPSFEWGMTGIVLGRGRHGVLLDALGIDYLWMRLVTELPDIGVHNAIILEPGGLVEVEYLFQAVRAR